MVVNVDGGSREESLRLFAIDLIETKKKKSGESEHGPWTLIELGKARKGWRRFVREGEGEKGVR